MTPSLRHHFAHEASGFSPFELLVAVIMGACEPLLDSMLVSFTAVSRCV